jgi:replicative DNA helicase
LNQVQRPQQNQNYEKRLNNVYSYLTDLAKGKRLFMHDASEIHGIEALELEIKRRLNRKLFVVIDGLYNLDIGINADQKKENIERADILKALADTRRIPLICTGELRKSKDRRVTNKPPMNNALMETGKFAYNANLVLLLYPDNWEDYDSQEEAILLMKYAKNKLSQFRGSEELIFKKTVSQIEERI